jgi:outer membrane lipoprotein carrier protein
MSHILACVCAAVAALLPFNPDAKAIAAKLEARYRAARTLQATFLERYSENGELVRTEAGEAYFRRPGKMRWEYESPEKNLFLVDGKTAWFYVPTDHTVTRAPAKESADWRTPLALLAGEMKLSRVCSNIQLAITEIPENSKDIVLRCKIRGQSGKSPESAADAGDLQDFGAEQAVYLEVDPNNGELARVLIRQKGGVSVDFKFGGWRFDPPLPDSFFRFNVPPGVAIVDGESPQQTRSQGNETK